MYVAHRSRSDDGTSPTERPSSTSPNRAGTTRAKSPLLADAPQVSGAGAVRPISLDRTLGSEKLLKPLPSQLAPGEAGDRERQWNDALAGNALSLARRQDLPTDLYDAAHLILRDLHRDDASGQSVLHFGQLFDMLDAVGELGSKHPSQKQASMSPESRAMAKDLMIRLLNARDSLDVHVVRRMADVEGAHAILDGPDRERLQALRDDPNVPVSNPKLKLLDIPPELVLGIAAKFYLSKSETRPLDDDDVRAIFALSTTCQKAAKLMAGNVQAARFLVGQRAIEKAGTHADFSLCLNHVGKSTDAEKFFKTQSLKYAFSDNGEASKTEEAISFRSRLAGKLAAKIEGLPAEEQSPALDELSSWAQDQPDAVRASVAVALMRFPANADAPENGRRAFELSEGLASSLPLAMHAELMPERLESIRRHADPETRDEAVAACAAQAGGMFAALRDEVRGAKESETPDRLWAMMKLLPVLPAEGRLADSLGLLDLMKEKELQASKRVLGKGEEPPMPVRLPFIAQMASIVPALGPTHQSLLMRGCIDAAADLKSAPAGRRLAGAMMKMLSDNRTNCRPEDLEAAIGLYKDLPEGSPEFRYESFHLDNWLGNILESFVDQDQLRSAMGHVRDGMVDRFTGKMPIIMKLFENGNRLVDRPDHFASEFSANLSLVRDKVPRLDRPYDGDYWFLGPWFETLKPQLHQRATDPWRTDQMTTLEAELQAEINRLFN
jgi:hypothetical protein